MRFLRSGLVAALVATLLVVPAGAVEIRAIKLSAGLDATRVVLELSARTPHSVMTLTNPDRIVIDLTDARLAPAARRAPGGSGVVKQVRMAHNASGERIVLDLSHSMRPRSVLASSSGRSGYRLVVELAGPGGVPSVHSAQAARHEAHVAARDPQAQESPSRGPAPELIEAPIKAEHARPDARDLIIAIDAGHGGDDPGAIGKNGTREKDVTLAIARALEQRLDSEPGMRAVLTRDGDYFVPLRDRMRRARARQADLFVSIHADSIRDRSVDGSSVYILSQHGATTEAARWLAEGQNAADLIGGVSLENKGDMLASVLLDLSQTASLTESHTAAEHVLRQLNLVGEVRKPLVQQAGFMVLKSPDIPSMLIETAYISNPAEELRLRSIAHQAKLAAAIHQGLRGYFYSDPPAGTRIALMAQGATRPELATTERDTSTAAPTL
ncbi:MAG: N-acetylmuramoyl-L-alanine amidase [Steroidobacteraceae bacterium]|jgi:N-acetylmuramoyl-L-alanine amidase